jgi:DNA topoisomerase VI subunit A
VDESKRMNKRAIYYLHRDIESTGELDSYIEELCQILEVQRDDLRIRATSKGLMFGGGIDLGMPEHLDSEVLAIPSYNNMEDFKEKMQPILTAKVVLVVEKDTLFNELIQDPRIM